MNFKLPLHKYKKSNYSNFALRSWIPLLYYNCIFLDIDECRAGDYVCPERATCINTDGSYECHCPIGLHTGSNNAACEGTRSATFFAESLHLVCYHLYLLFSIKILTNVRTVSLTALTVRRVSTQKEALSAENHRHFVVHPDINLTKTLLYAEVSIYKIHNTK